ncbi:alpha/beta hydrolase [Streptomyces phaeolivaceus]|uniref:Alpha/beta hydrolase n=1 Tax=Streptomyces phaeolivaceus TaxID=2653200 RepID=A0A5P8KJT3_9ACTN|nr:alpha/beta hydrolase [Streptomyces phaeolivaceus]
MPPTPPAPPAPPAHGGTRPYRRTRGRLAVAAIATALFGQLLTGTSSAAAPTVPTPLAGPLEAIDWEPCESPYGKGVFECGTLAVPLDRRHPDGATVDLALVRHRATDPDLRIGPLLLNPGGPGMSGVDLAFSAPSSFSPELVERFDFVGFDTRGTHASTPAYCDGDLTAARRAALDPQDEAGLDALRAANRAFADSCRTLSGPLAAHMDSASVAHDMDAIRVALGERRISYWGGSYGTLIGQMYAELFPRRVRAMVLDSNMDHSLDAWGIQRTRAETLEGAFGEFADWCARTSTCALHGRDVRALYASLHDAAEEGRLIYYGRPMSASTFRSVTSGQMNDPDTGWPLFAQILSAMSTTPATPATSTQTPVSATAAPVSATAAPVKFAYDLILCQDYDLDVPSYAAIDRMERRLAEIAPLTRQASLSRSYLASCQNWTDTVANPQHPLRVHGSPPILVTNSRYDVATPHAWAANAARQIGREATLLTYDGVGHITYWRSACVRAATDTYLTTLETPAKGTHCPANWPGDSGQRLGAEGGGLVDPLAGSRSVLEP